MWDGIGQGGFCEYSLLVRRPTTESGLPNGRKRLDMGHAVRGGSGGREGTLEPIDNIHTALPRLTAVSSFLAPAPGRLCGDQP